MKLKDEFKKTQGKKWLVPWSDQKEIEYQAAYIRFLESRIEKLTIPAVVGRSEQLKALLSKVVDEFDNGEVTWDTRDEIEGELKSL